MIIHFVCTGNIYRSRLAEAYLKSKKISSLKASSSGTAASNQNKGPISWYAARLSFRYGLVKYMSPSWINTTAEMIKNADITIFIGNNNFEWSKRNLPAPKKYEVWDLPDFDDEDLNGKQFNSEKELEYIKNSEMVFHLIRTNVDGLLLKLNSI